MNSLKPHEQLYWESYLKSLPETAIPKNAFVYAGYAGTPDITGDSLPKIGHYWIYLNSSGKPSCILQTRKIEIYKFKDIPVEVAIAEGEGDLTLAYWRKVHSELYFPYLESWGIKDIDEATAIVEFYDIVFK